MYNYYYYYNNYYNYNNIITSDKKISLKIINM